MINSRSLSDLLPCVRERCIAFEKLADETLKDAGIDLIWTSTYRDNESQAQLFAQGRTKPGRIVTNARAGESFHNHKVAADFALLYHGKTIAKDDDFLIWDTKKEYVTLWQSIGVLAELSGLEWSGRWKGSLREMAHVQYTNGISLADLRAGKTPC